MAQPFANTLSRLKNRNTAINNAVRGGSIGAAAPAVRKAPAARNLRDIDAINAATRARNAELAAVKRKRKKPETLEEINAQIAALEGR